MRWSQMVFVATMFMVILTNPGRSQPQTNMMIHSCSTVNATNYQNFFSNLNETLKNIRRKLSNSNTYFAITDLARDSVPIYVLAQCRKYMSTSDCISCFDFAANSIYSCAPSIGGRVALDGCFLRYESVLYCDQTTLPGNQGLCGNRTSSRQSIFKTVVDGLLLNLSIATPKMNGFFAAVTAPVVGTNISTAYAIAQCAETITPDGCKSCLQVAYANVRICATDVTDGRAVDTGCFMRYSDTAFFGNNQTTDITPFLQDESSSNRGAVIGGVVGGVSGVIFLSIAVLLWYYRSRRPTADGHLYDATDLQGPKDYSYSDLKKATKYFREKNKLGQGRFGDVYKGTGKDGNIIAVKKLAIGSSTAKDSFKSEVRVISNLHHRNLIRLLGCCCKGPELLLVFEYMANGSLENYLYGEKRGTLNWKQRCDIIFGIARGLAYLHEQYHITIIHRDIKPSNIFIDDDFQPKIADFGLARLLPDDQTDHIRSRFPGTLGYTAPEYAIHGQLSEKVDTYSFGIVVLEIVSGRRCTDIPNESAGEQCLLEHAWNLYEARMHLKLVDETLDPTKYKEDDIKKVTEIALMCTQSPVSVRPTMSEVVMFLSEQSRLQIPPSRQSVNFSDAIYSTSTPKSLSNANATITELIGR